MLLYVIRDFYFVLGEFRFVYKLGQLRMVFRRFFIFLVSELFEFDGIRVETWKIIFTVEVV